VAKSRERKDTAIHSYFDIVHDTRVSMKPARLVSYRSIEVRANIKVRTEPLATTPQGEENILQNFLRHPRVTGYHDGIAPEWNV